ncbi:MAG: calcium/sodium antiporter [Candidatus Methylacidiphilales bacterium]
MMIDLIWVCLGLVLLYYGAEWLITGAASTAVRCGISPLVAGLTVVAFGTSAPELVVSLSAAFKGNPDVAVGNVVGSNIFNVAVILGLVAVICPIRIQLQLLRVDMPILIVVTLIAAAILHSGAITRGWGAILFAGIIAYTTFAVIMAKRESNRAATQEFAEEVKTTGKHPLFDIGLIVVGLLVLVGGGQLFVQGSVGIARDLGLSDAIIGLTLVAAGTSLPELAASLVAAAKKEADIAVGNIVGSNLFNLLSILGLTALVHPLQVSGITWWDLGTMIVTTVVLLPLMWTGSILRRWEGLILLLMYGVYLAVLWP